jgi:hypothetical protein
MAQKGQLRFCDNGHRFYKSGDCPVCPVCEKERAPSSGFMTLLAAPARRALENKGIHSLKALADYSEAEILQLHGMGKNALGKLQTALASEGLSFRK